MKKSSGKLFIRPGRTAGYGMDNGLLGIRKRPSTLEEVHADAAAAGLAGAVAAKPEQRRSSARDRALMKLDQWNRAEVRDHETPADFAKLVRQVTAIYCAFALAPFPREEAVKVGAVRRDADLYALAGRDI